MPKWLNKATTYTFAWCLYWTQGSILPTGSIATQFLVAILLVVSFYFVFVANVRYKLPVYFVGLNALLVMFSAYGIFLILNFDVNEYAFPLPRFNYLKDIYISLLPIYSFYVFAKEKNFSEKIVFWTILLFFGVVTINYFHDYQQQLIIASLLHSSAEEFTNNVGYSFLALIPACTFFYKKPVLQYIALAYCASFMVMGMKRGAILIGILCFVWIIWENLKGSNLKKKIGVVFLTVALFFSGYVFVQHQLNESLYFQKRIEDTMAGNSSGRDNLYAYFIDYFWNETSPLQFIFGSGANATIKVGRNFAHNDWLEIAVNQGALGVFVYLFYWVVFLKTIVSRNRPPSVQFALQLFFVIYCIKTMFSMSYAEMEIPATFTLGYCLAQEEKYAKVV